MNERFDIETLDYHLPNYWRGFRKQFILDRVFDEEYQKDWVPQDGDVFVGSTGNIFVISGSHQLTTKMGGIMYFFNGMFCNRDGKSNFMNETMSYCMNKEGVIPKSIYNSDLFKQHVSKISDYRVFFKPSEYHETPKAKFLDRYHTLEVLERIQNYHSYSEDAIQELQALYDFIEKEKQQILNS